MKQVPAQTRARLAACAAVGLSYWSGHPAVGCVWAVDDAQQAHQVKVDYKRGRAQRVYEPAKVYAPARVGPWADFDADDWQAALMPAAEEVAA